MIMRPTEGVAYRTALRGPAGQGQPPVEVRLTVPAHLSLLATIQAAVRTHVGELGGARGDQDLLLATEETAALLIQDARPGSAAHLSIVHDDIDIYVRIATRRLDPGRRLVIDELTQLLLDNSVESYDVCADGLWSYAILQTSQPEAS